MRYSHDQLLATGKSGVFRLLTLSRSVATVEGLRVGEYFICHIKDTTNGRIDSGVGLTPLQAIERTVDKLT